MNAARRGKTAQAEDLQKTINDPVARKLVEWAILRSDGTNSIDLRRYMAFITDNPSWPAVGLLRRRAEATLWADRLDPAFVRAFFAKERPTTDQGQVRARPRAAAAGRPRRRAEPGARGLAQ